MATQGHHRVLQDTKCHRAHGKADSIMHAFRRVTFRAYLSLFNADIALECLGLLVFVSHTRYIAVKSFERAGMYSSDHVRSSAVLLLKVYSQTTSRVRDPRIASRKGCL